ncbi:hypothetical protein BDV29DRAFT_170891 [Aspergillus leporis]|uniref:Uncharacterized protein n=1 Tax=Aspergillus leporis TaxID=41062 RepID=A0A5N5X5S0_9EURO|nr:hypothetical protein BDV29DRAFT_170891 [Aspergillus leporis]
MWIVCFPVVNDFALPGRSRCLLFLPLFFFAFRYFWHLFPAMSLYVATLDVKLEPKHVI